MSPPNVTLTVYYLYNSLLLYTKFPKNILPSNGLNTGLTHLLINMSKKQMLSVQKAYCIYNVFQTAVQGENT